MICIDDIVRVIRDRFDTEVSDHFPYTIEVLYDNVDVEDIPAEGTTWIRWAVLPYSYEKVDFGSNPRYREYGNAVAEIYIPINQGDREGYEIAHRIRAAFRSTNTNWVRFRSPTIRRLGRNGRFHQINVECPFDADEIVGYPFTKGFSEGFETYG